MNQTTSQQLGILCDFLAERRKAILAAWRKAAEADPEQTTAHGLTRGQFNDHIPEVLDAFEQLLRSPPGGANAQDAIVDKKAEEVKHGLHRWQQGYRLQELMHEWGHLQLCLFEELNDFAKAHPEIDRETLVEANRQMVSMVNAAISGSAAQYERMQQAEAAGHLEDLTLALTRVNEIERRRSTLIHQAVHDLKSNAFGVSIAAGLLGNAEIADAQRVEFASLVKQGVHEVTAMLGELMELARLEAGQEIREINTFDAAALITELCNVNRPFSRARGLFLKMDGPAPFVVEGDSGKVRRLLQNLVLNALKYTESGGVILSWGEEKKNWWLMVKDTGPGLLSGPSAPMSVGLKEATASARESDEKTAEAKGESSHVLAPTLGESTAMSPSHPQPGEGIGLSIVKRLCELLDASLEMASSAKSGTTFRVVFPRRYQPSRAGQPAG